MNWRAHLVLVVAVALGVLAILSTAPPAMASVVGGYSNRNGFETSWWAENQNGQTWMGASVQSSQHMVDWSWISIQPDWNSRADGLVGFVINLSIRGYFGGPLNQDPMRFSFNEDRVNLNTGVEYYTYDDGGKIVATNYGSGSASVESAKFDWAETGSWKSPPTSWDNPQPQQWGRDFWFHGHFTDPVVGAVFLQNYAVTPEPASMFLIGGGALAMLRRRRRW